MTKKAAALILSLSLPASLASAQEVVYVIPAASEPPIGYVEKPEQSPRLNEQKTSENSLNSRRGLWRGGARGDLYAKGSMGGDASGNSDRSGADGGSAGGAGTPPLNARGGVRGGDIRASEPAGTAERDRRVVYAHRVREGGVREPDAELTPDGRRADMRGRNGRAGYRPETGAPAAGTESPGPEGYGREPRDPIPDGTSQPYGASQPYGTSQPASAASTYAALKSSAGAAGTSNSLFVDDALMTVRERSHPEWEALGVRAGAFILRPTADLETEFTDNAGQSASNRKSDVVGILRAGFSADSDWSRHALSASVSAEIGRYRRETDQNYVSLDMALRGRLDIRRNTTLDTELGYELSRESSSTISSASSAARRPMVSNYHASALGTHRFNRLSLSLRGGFDYAQYGKTLLSGGGSAGNEDRDYFDLTSTARATYEVKPGVSVYGEAGVSLRRHIRNTDSSGLRRASDGVSASLGAQFEIGRLIRADASVGVVHRNYHDGSLKDVTALIANGKLAWNATELTTVYAEVSTEVSETDLAGMSATVERLAVFGVQHELLRNVTLGAELSGGYNSAIGSATRETVFGAELSADYHINRRSSLSANVTHSRHDSNQSGGDYNENTVRLGLNLKL